MTDFDELPGGVHRKTLGVRAQVPIDPDSPRDVTVFATTDAVDADNEVVLPGGADLSRFEKNPVLLLNHAAGQPGTAGYGLPIGKVVGITRRPRGLMAGLVFSRNTEMGREVKSLYEEGIMSAVSIGFRPIEASPMTREEAESRPDWKAAYDRAKGRILVHRRWLMLELSCVCIPSNQDALVVRYASKGLSLPSWLQLPTSETPIMPDPALSVAEGDAIETKSAVSDKPWDAAAARQRLAKWASSDGSGDKDTIDFAKYGRAFLYCDESARDSLGSYKLPVYDVEGGKLVLVKAALRAAASALGGGRGGIDIPESDLPAVKARLAKLEKEAGVGEAQKSHKCPDGSCEGECKDMDDGDDMETEGYHCKMCKAVADVAKSIKHSGDYGMAFLNHETKTVHHTMADGDGKPDFDGSDEIKAKYMAIPGIKAVQIGDEYSPKEEDGFMQVHPPKRAKAMAEGSGAAGGYATKPEDKARPIDDDTDEGPDEPDGDDDADDLDEAGGFKKGMHVRIKAPHYRGVGVVQGVYDKGHVPNVDEDLRATAAEPAARVKAYKAFGDGHMPTEHHVGAMCKHLAPLPEPLKAPSKPAKTLEPVPARKAKATPAAKIEPLPPLVAISDEELQRQALEQIQSIPTMVKAELDRVLGVV